MKTKLFFIAIILLGLTSCGRAGLNLINEESVVEKIAKSNDSKHKFLVTTEDYWFYTNTQYNVGDTLRIKK